MSGNLVIFIQSWSDDVLRSQGVEGVHQKVEPIDVLDEYIHQVNAIRKMLLEAIDENMPPDVSEQLRFYFLESIKGLEEVSSMILWLKNYEIA